MPADDRERVLDVREIDGAPFDDIVAALDALDTNDRLRLVAPFEPIPLYDVLDERGFDYRSEQPEEGLFHVLIEAA